MTQAKKLARFLVTTADINSIIAVETDDGERMELIASREQLELIADTLDDILVAAAKGANEEDEDEEDEDDEDEDDDDDEEDEDDDEEEEDEDDDEDGKSDTRRAGETAH